MLGEATTIPNSSLKRFVIKQGSNAPNSFKDLKGFNIQKSIKKYLEEHIGQKEVKY